MFVVKWIVVVLLLVALVLVGAGQAGLLKGHAPTNLGVRDGRLLPPSRTPNSVSSQARLYPDHPMHGQAAIRPLPVKGSGPATLARIKEIVAGMDGSEVVESETGYLYVRFTTPVLKFVDDAEFWYDRAENAIQVRSASRLGSKDFGTNRSRIEAIRQRLTAQ